MQLGLTSLRCGRTTGVSIDVPFDGVDQDLGIRPKGNS